MKTTKRAVQVFERGAKQYVPTVRVNDRALEEIATEAAFDVLGSSVALGDDHFAALVMGGDHGDFSNLPFGAWVIEYRYDTEQGINSMRIFVAAEIE